jgi:PAS domain S-box-containing protein
LPLLFSSLIAVVLATFLWVAFREVEQALIRTGADRAQAAADQLATLFGPSLRQRHTEFRRAAGDDAVRALVSAASPQTESLARTRLQALFTSGLQTIEVWTAGGLRLLRLESAPEAAVLGSAPPVSTGLMMVQPAPPTLVAVATDSIDAAGAPDAPGPRIGYLVVRRPVVVNTTSDVLNRLIGGGARVALGGNGGDWTDLKGIVAAPPIGQGPGVVTRERGMDGVPATGALAEMAGSPWRVWVEFPHHALVGQARAFLRDMLLVALGFVIVGAIASRVLTGRITRPLIDLTEASEAIAGGDYTRQVTNARRDEIGRLGTAFNQMVAQVRDAHDRLAGQVSERTAALEALKESEARHRHAAETIRQNDERTQFALEAARAGIWEADLGTGQITWSETMRLVHGLPREDFGGTVDDLLSLIHPEHREQLAHAMRENASHPGEFELEARVIWPDGSTHWMQSRGRVRAEADGRPTRVLGVAQDITSHKRLETQLRQAQKMEAIGRLAGGVAHDFNNVLTAVLGFAALLESEQLPDDERRQYAAEVRLAAERAADLTRQLLAFSRQQVLEPRLVTLHEAIAALVPMLQRLAGEHIDIAIENDPVGMILADAGQLEQIVMNLVANAADAMARGGRLTLKTREMHIDGEIIGADLKPGRYIVLEVTDTGIGMDAATQARIFEPFFTTKELGRGTGLGLSTVHGVVTQMNGSISVYSEVGHGTTFRIYFPPAGGTEPARAVLPAPPLSVGGRERILLVEDEAAVRSLAVTALRRYGYQVVAAASPADAVQMVGADDRFDLIISDVMMPGGVGPELVATLRARQPNVSALYMSGYSGAALALMGNLDDGSHFIQKPFTITALLAKIRQILDAPAGASATAPGSGPAV